MAEDNQNPSLHIDTDWKKQAQEEKRRLAEEEQKRAAATTPPPGGSPSGGPASAGPETSAAPTGTRMPRGRSGGAAGARGGERAMPEASFTTLLNSLVTQILLYIGDLTPRGVEPQINLDMAKFNIDLLAVLEEKTKGNLSPDEQKLLDNALYETRMRFISVASQYASV
jgi:hypothetical protein